MFHLASDRVLTVSISLILHSRRSSIAVGNRRLFFAQFCGSSIMH